MSRSRSMFIALMLLVTVALLPSSTHAAEFAGDVNFFLGTKYLEQDDWAPLEDQAAFGAEMSWRTTDWPVSLATDLFFSIDYDENIIFDQVAATTEFDVGVRKIWEAGRTRPFLGGGIGILSGYIDNSCISGGGGCFDVDDRGVKLGGWVNGGVFWRLGGKFNIGLSARYSAAKAEVSGADRELGGFQFGLLLGFGWPKYDG